MMERSLPGWKYLLHLLLASILAVTAGTVIVVVALSYLQINSYLHPPRRLATGDFLKTNNIKYQEVELTTEDGVKLRAWYTPPKNGAVILVAHGHGDRIPEQFYALFAMQGYGVLAWDFRAHGKSGGDFTSLGYYEVLDVKAALDFTLAQPGVEHIGGWGGSMGAATMLRAAARYPQIEAVVADSSFATLEDVIPLRIPYPVLRPLMRFFAEMETGVSVDQVRPVDDIGRISPRPVFIIQGMGENAVPVDSAQRLYDAANEPRLLWTEPDVPHMNMYAYFKTRYEKRVIKFFDQYLLGE
jgi:fermentation-respiration switch protein FrsA (DUF1100 family)